MKGLNDYQQMKQLKDPYELVAEALETDKSTLTEKSKMHNHPNWDSVENVSIMVALEEHYGLEIKDAMRYNSMEAILQLYKQLQNS